MLFAIFLNDQLSEHELQSKATKSHIIRSVDKVYVVDGIPNADLRN